METPRATPQGPRCKKKECLCRGLLPNGFFQHLIASECETRVGGREAREAFHDAQEGMCRFGTSIGARPRDQAALVKRTMHSPWARRARTTQTSACAEAARLRLPARMATVTFR